MTELATPPVEEHTGVILGWRGERRPTGPHE